MTAKDDLNPYSSGRTKARLLLRLSAGDREGLYWMEDTAVSPAVTVGQEVIISPYWVRLLTGINLFYPLFRFKAYKRVSDSSEEEDTVVNGQGEAHWTHLVPLHKHVRFSQLSSSQTWHSPWPHSVGPGTHFITYELICHDSCSMVPFLHSKTVTCW